MQQRRLNFFERIALELLWYSAKVFAILPHWYKYYVVSNTFFVLLYYIFRYRRKVVRENLEGCFPQKSVAERKIIERKFYVTLSDMFIDTFNMAYMTKRKARRIVNFENLEQHLINTGGKSWIYMTAHYACWEYNMLWGAFDESYVASGVYHPLRSAVVDNFYLRLRSVMGAVSVPMQESIRYYMRHYESGDNGRVVALGLISDQNPPRKAYSHWFNFLGRDTLFFSGGEKMALKFGVAVYFGVWERVKRGRYRVRFEPIYDGVEVVEENVITERYVRQLESQIVKRPELWMWSHRRWKHNRQNVKS